MSAEGLINRVYEHIDDERRKKVAPVLLIKDLNVMSSDVVDLVLTQPDKAKMHLDELKCMPKHVPREFHMPNNVGIVYKNDFQSEIDKRKEKDAIKHI